MKKLLCKLLRNLVKNSAFLTVCLLVGLSWSWLFLIDVARLSSSALASYGIVLVVFLAITCGTSWAYWRVLRYLLRGVATSKRGSLQVIKIFFVWSFIEMVISWLSALIWMGHNGSFDTTLPFASFTPYLMWTPLRFLSRFTGYYGLSAAVIAGIFILMSHKLRRFGIPFVVAITIVTLFSWRMYKHPNGAQIKSTLVAEQIGAPTAVNTHDSEFVLLPEYGLDDYPPQKISQRFASSNGVYFVGSRQIPGDTGFSNTLVFGDSRIGYLTELQKSRLIPGGEYLSLPVESVLKLFVPSIYSDFQVRRAVVKGRSAVLPYSFTNQLVVGSAVCSSIISPEDYRLLTRRGASVLTNSASLEIFRGSRLFSWQHRGLAKFMAVANARPMLQSSNNWQAFALDQNGTQLGEVQPVKSLQVTVAANTTLTPYTLLGEWPAYCGGFWVIFDLVLRLRKRTIAKSIPSKR